MHLGRLQRRHYKRNDQAGADAKHGVVNIEAKNLDVVFTRFMIRGVAFYHYFSLRLAAVKNVFFLNMFNVLSSYLLPLHTLNN